MEKTKISELNYQDIADYLRISDIDANEIKFLESLLDISINFIKNYTGITEDLDNYPEFLIVIYVLCQDMYDNRTLYIDKNDLNKVVSTVLDMHVRNLL